MSYRHRVGRKTKKRGRHAPGRWRWRACGQHAPARLPGQIFAGEIFWLKPDIPKKPHYVRPVGTLFEKVTGFTATHEVVCCRCFLPDLTGFTSLRCTGPGHILNATPESGPLLLMDKRAGINPNFNCGDKLTCATGGQAAMFNRLF